MSEIKGIERGLTVFIVVITILMPIFYLIDSFTAQQLKDMFSAYFGFLAGAFYIWIMTVLVRYDKNEE